MHNYLCLLEITFDKFHFLYKVYVYILNHRTRDFIIPLI